MTKTTNFMDKTTVFGFLELFMGENVKYVTQAYFRIDNIDDRSVNILVNSCGEQIEKNRFQTRMEAGRRDYYLMYVLGGRMDAVIAGKKGVLERGAVVCITPGTPYFYANTSEGTDFVRYRWIHFTGNNVDSVLSNCEIVPNEIMRVDVREEVYSLWEDLFYEFRNNTAKVDASAAVILPYILMKVGKSKVEAGDGGRKLDLSIRYIHTHLASSLSVEELSAMEFLSPSRYREVFRKVTGYSPVEYITLLRLRQAAELLSEGEVTIEEAALAVGYTDRLYFQRVFKKHMGVTPGNYLKKVKG